MVNRYKLLAENLNQVFAENSRYLCQLDGNAGDGDHGLTISRGFARAQEKVAQLPDSATATQVLKEIGYGMLESMGGASGPIFSTFFIQAAIELRDGGELTAANLKNVLHGSYDAIADLCSTHAGEKTMLDALHAALTAVENAPSESLAEVLQTSAQGAQAGAESTVEMLATKGRARFLGERSRGFMDAGSWSVALIFRTMRDTLVSQ